MLSQNFTFDIRKKLSGFQNTKPLTSNTSQAKPRQSS